MLALIESIDLMEICKLLHALPCVFVCVNLKAMFANLPTS